MTAKIDYLKPVGIIAGSGLFPLWCAKELKNRGAQVLVCAHEGETLPELQNIADFFCWVKVAQLGKIIKFFQQYNCQQAIFIGGISRTKLFKGFLPDWLGLKAIQKAGSLQDDKILRSATNILNEHNIEVFGVDQILTDLKASKGVLTSKTLTPQQINDAKLGWQIAKDIGNHDIGQTVVICDGLVVAIECVEGTDQTLLRAGILTQGKKSIAVKVPKPQQDKRLDLPAIGPNTIETMNQANISGLVLEDQGALILDPKNVVFLANKYSICIEVW